MQKKKFKKIEGVFVDRSAARLPIGVGCIRVKEDRLWEPVFSYPQRIHLSEYNISEEFVNKFVTLRRIIQKQYKSFVKLMLSDGIPKKNIPSFHEFSRELSKRFTNGN